RSMRGVDGLATDGRAIAYPAQQFTTLWWTPSSVRKPVRVFKTRGPAYHVDNSVQIAGRLVGFGAQPRTFLADAGLDRYIELNRGGWTLLDSTALVLLKATAVKAIHGKADIV